MDDFRGSSELFKKITYEHALMIFNIRNYLYIFASHNFGHNLGSDQDLDELSKSFQEQDTYRFWPDITISDLANNELWCALASMSDFESTKKFYKKFLKTCFQGSSLENKPEILKMIITNVDFRIV